MKGMLKIHAVCAGLLALSAMQVSAATWQIGDNDGYGAGIPDNANHNFDGFAANYDGRSAAEAAATNGAQYTDTYSTPQWLRPTAGKYSDIYLFWAGQ